MIRERHMSRKHVAMYGSSLEELVLPDDLERGSVGTCLIVVVVVVYERDYEVVYEML